MMPSLSIQQAIPAPFGDAVVAAARRVSWRTLGVTLALSVALGMFAGYRSDAGQLPDVLALASYALTGVCMMFATLVTDERVAMGAKRLRSYAAAVIIGLSVGALVQWPLLDWISWLAVEPFRIEIRIVHTVYLLAEGLMWGSIIVFIYANRRSALDASRRMKALQVQRTELQRRSLESRLQALQARVEPQFLFDSLARVRDSYESDAAKGSQMLADLIAYLRAALPYLREATSTLRRELDLVGAYLNVMRAQLGANLTSTIDASDESRSARMPAMVLLPLVNHVLGARATPRDDDATIRIAARHTVNKLTVEVAYDSRKPVTTAIRDCADIRERLRGLYGTQWSLQFAPSEQGTRAILEIPYEPTDSGHR